MGNKEDPTKYQPPKMTVTDGVHKIGKALVSLTPGVGGAAVELYETLWKAPLDKRMASWTKLIAEGLGKIEQNFEKLAENPVFVSNVFYATQAALRTHQKDKLEALRNAVLNSTLPTAPNEDLQLIFINLLDSMTVSHIRVLEFLADPRSYLKGKVSDQEGVRGHPLYPYLEKAFPEMNRTFYMMIVDQLKARGLTEVNVDQKAEKLFKVHTTGLGRDLVQFIKAPFEPDE